MSIARVYLLYRGDTLLVGELSEEMLSELESAHRVIRETPTTHGEVEYTLPLETTANSLFGRKKRRTPDVTLFVKSDTVRVGYPGVEGAEFPIAMMTETRDETRVTVGNAVVSRLSPAPAHRRAYSIWALREAVEDTDWSAVTDIIQSERTEYDG